MDEAGAGQPALTRNFAHPGQQPRAQQRAKQAGQRRFTHASGRHQIRAHLHHQQPHAQTEPQAGMLAPTEYPLGGWHRSQSVIDNGRILIHGNTDYR